MVKENTSKDSANQDSLIPSFKCHRHPECYWDTNLPRQIPFPGLPQYANVCTIALRESNLGLRKQRFLQTTILSK